VFAIAKKAFFPGITIKIGAKSAQAEQKYSSVKACLNDEGEIAFLPYMGQ
jgi:hypothetical protein